MTGDLADASAALDRDGFVILERRLEQGAVTDARNEIERLLAKTSWGSGFDGDRTRRVWALLAKSRCMDDAALDSLVLALADHAIGPGAQFSLTQATQIHPGQAVQPLHYEQGIYPIPRDGDVMVTAIWALDDFTAENGGTLVVPGSHAASAARPTSHKVMSIEMPAGSVLVFRGRLWHAGGSNTTNNPRLGVIIDYAQPWLRPCEAHALTVDLESARGLPQRLQELLGFNQATPYLGFVDGRHPRDWLQNQPSGDRSPTRIWSV